MPSPYIKNLSRETGKSQSEIEDKWKKAKGITSETFGKPEENWGDKEYGYTVGVVKNMLGYGEDSFKPIDFLKAEGGAKDFIETVVSGDFSLGNVVSSERKKKVVQSTNYDKSAGRVASGDSSEGDALVDLGLDGIKELDESKGKNSDIDTDDFLGLEGIKTFYELRRRGFLKTEGMYDGYDIQWWEERGYYQVVVYHGAENEVWSASDQTVVELIEDGFIKWEDDASVLEYLRYMDILRENTKKCPDCGGKYPEKTGYCVKCKKKVKKEDLIDEKIGGEPFSSNLHADEGDALQDREPNADGNYEVDSSIKEGIQKEDIESFIKTMIEEDDLDEDELRTMAESYVLSRGGNLDEYGSILNNMVNRWLQTRA